ncbi:unnamed protein product [Ceutorhynchus assimilis]|uniref:Uncharacterized protein n=1 Tax=Ceutorhynchus assimilis TaxID=467358 RepID=A0A9N9N0L5_9CUCU|nr:unnamed protein product [Ceutorhynchus assimilis]
MFSGQNVTDYVSTYTQENQSSLKYSSALVENVENHYKNEILESQPYESQYFHFLEEIEKSRILQQQLLERIVQENQKHEQFEKDTTESTMHTENLKTSIEKLERLEVKKEAEAKELEQSVASFKGKLQSVVKEKEKLIKLRQEILTYKVLTKVDLVFSSKKVTGLILRDVPKPIRYDPEKLSMEEITKQIWELILDK